MLEEIVRKAKEKLAGYDWEIFYFKNKKLKSESNDLKIDKLTASEDVGFSIRVIKSGRQGFSYSTTLDKDSVEFAIQSAKGLCDIATEEEDIILNDRLEKGNEIEYFDTFAVNLPVEEKIEKAIELERLVRTLNDRIKSVRSSTFTENIYEKILINSLGIEVKEIGTVYSAKVSAVATDGRDSQIAWSYNAKRFISDLNLEEIAKEAVFNSTSLLGATTVSTKNMYVLFPPYAMVELLDAFSYPFLADALIKGKTLFKDKIGQKVAYEEITIVDNGILEKGLMSSTYDAEGVLKRKNILIEKGVLNGFLHNLHTAKKLGALPTGNSVRSDFRTLPTVGITNFYIENGKQNIKDVISELDEIFYVIDMMGLHTADPISGDFSLGVNGLIISRGEIVKAVRGATLSGNFIELLQKVISVGDDLKFYGNLGSSSILVENLTIAGD
ncbi:MAG: TldD/PmbA family protein [Hydrogenothermaceae bacterium]